MSLLIVPYSTQALTQALQALASGGVVAHATETCYGLACDLSNPDAVAKLFRIKERPEDQPVSALFSSVIEAKKFVEWNDEAEKLAKKFLPGPLTLILPLRKDRPFDFFVVAQSPPLARFASGDSKLKAQSSAGIRLSSLPLATELVARFGKPLSTTSANIHGLPSTYSAEEIVAQFKGRSEQPDLVIDSGVIANNPPSKIIDLSQGEAKVLRH